MDKSAQRYIDLAFEYHVAAMTLNSQIFDAPYVHVSKIAAGKRFAYG